MLKYPIQASMFMFLYAIVTQATYFNRYKFSTGKCRFDAERIGKCLRLADCPSAIGSFKKMVYPKVCGYNYNEPMICCGPENNLVEGSISNGEIARQKCSEYTITATTGFILNGEISFPQEFPHMAVLGFGSENNIKWKCGGTLISENFVLTAAHCLRCKKYNEAYVQLGSNRIDYLGDAGLRIKIRNTFQHPDYTPKRRYNDIALLELEKEVDFHEFVKPACLQVDKKIGARPFIATGWGATRDGGNFSMALRKIKMTYVPFQRCINSYQPELRLEQGLKDEQQFCARDYQHKGDTCQGDSGGPLQYKLEESDLYFVVGITSFGAKCGLLPSVYTRVSYYVPWIESIVWPQ